MESKIFKAPRLIKTKLSASTIRGGDGKSVVGSLNTTNKILVEIQNQLALDFASRISERKLQNDALRAAADKKKRADAEQTIEGTRESGKIRSALGRNLARVISPAKDIFGKILNFLGGLTLAFVTDKVLKWFANPENKRKIDTAMTYLEKNGSTILKILGGVVLGKVLSKILRITKGLRRATKSLRIFGNISKALRRIPFLGKMFPKKGLPKIPGLRGLGIFASAFNFLDRIGQGQSLTQAAAGTGAEAGGFLAGAKVGGVAGAALGSVIPGPGTVIGGLLGSLIGGLFGAYGAGKLADSLTGVQGYSDGGLVKGKQGDDQVPAKLTAGEYVIPKDPTSQFLPLLSDIRTGGSRFDSATQSMQQSNRMFAETLRMGNISSTLTGGKGMSGAFTVPSPSYNVRSVPFIPVSPSLSPSEMPSDTITVMPPVLSPPSGASPAVGSAPAGGDSIPIFDALDFTNDYIPQVIDDFGIFVLDEV